MNTSKAAPTEPTIQSNQWRLVSAEACSPSDEAEDSALSFLPRTRPVEVGEPVEELREGVTVDFTVIFQKVASNVFHSGADGVLMVFIQLYFRMNELNQGS